MDKGVFPALQNMHRHASLSYTHLFKKIYLNLSYVLYDCIPFPLILSFSGHDVKQPNHPRQNPIAHGEICTQV